MVSPTSVRKVSGRPDSEFTRDACAALAMHAGTHIIATAVKTTYRQLRDVRVTIASGAGRGCGAFASRYV
jgi:hypothetical protein